MNGTSTGTATSTYPTCIDFASRTLTGNVRGLRPVGDDGFTIVTLDFDRVAIGDVGQGELDVGVSYQFFGAWAVHDRYGAQFRFDGFAPCAGQGQNGTIAFLSRSSIGLTRAQARKLWQQYGPEAIATLRDRPEEVIADALFRSENSELVINRASSVLRGDAEWSAVKVELFELFSGRGFPRGVVKECVRLFGHDAPAAVRRDPFKLIVKEVKGVGFKRADQLYLDLGGDPARIKRATLAAWHALHTSGSGNTWEAKCVADKAVMEAIGVADEARIGRAVRLGLRARWLDQLDGGQWITEKFKSAAEERLARHVKRILKHDPHWIDLPDDSPVSDHQREQLRAIMDSALAILAGTPGTGKTFTAAALLKALLRSFPPGRIKVCAPTGKAAVRISEAMQRYNLPLQATTIHGLLGACGYGEGGYEFARNETTPLECDVVIVDESSMIDTGLAAALLAAVPPKANVLLVGDPYQLPPVQHGAPLRDLMAANVPTAMLAEIKRNSGRIVTACRDIAAGCNFDVSPRVDLGAGENLICVPCPNPEHQQAAIIQTLEQARVRGFDPVWDCQVLCLMNDRGPVSRKPLNDVLKRLLNPMPAAPGKNARFSLNDKVICLDNNWLPLWVERNGLWRDTGDEVRVANGDMGRVLAVNESHAIVKFLCPDRTVRIPTGRQKKADRDRNGSDADERVDFDLAYAITTHKSQGSEWPVVLVVLDDMAARLGCRELLYTAISRASKLCVLIGHLGTAYKWVGRETLSKRKTFLKELLAATTERS